MFVILEMCRLLEKFSVASKRGIKVILRINQEWEKPTLITSLVRFVIKGTLA